MYVGKMQRLTAITAVGDLENVGCDELSRWELAKSLYRSGARESKECLKGCFLL